MKKVDFLLQMHKFVEIYEIALRIRRVEEAIASRYQQGKMRCPVHLSIGQEVPAAVFGVLKSTNDLVVSSHRSHAHYLAAGGSLRRMIAEIYGKESGCSGGRGGSMHLFDKSVGFMGSSAIVGNSIPVGTGLALSQKLLKSDAVTFIFFGEGATEEGVFYESLNFAAVQDLPVIFFCENNKYSVYTGIEDRQPNSREIFKVSNALGVDSFKASDNNIFFLQDTLNKAILKARSGDGPCLIEVETYRFLEHCGPNDDDDLGYRPFGELNYHRENDPLKLLYHQLIEADSKFYDHNANLEVTIKEEIDDAFDFAEQSAFPTLSDILNGQGA